ncbi:MAG: prepilin-type N-terminal cleavage/methylation domain-containing protein [Hyphomicrobiaceae bacterium]|jgi:prepilin-type N-terminal cleavage/methylation domain-containing protein
MSYVSTGLQAASHKRACRYASQQRGGEHGFTLLETLTAITILAIALTSLFGAYASGIKAARSGDDYTRAQILAQSLIAQTTLASGRPPVSAGGTSGPFRWHVRVRLASSNLTGELTHKRWALYQINAVVAWDASRTFELQTLKLARRLE